MSIFDMQLDIFGLSLGFETFFFVAVIFLYTIFSCLFHKEIKDTASILITLGILGTFVGISIGLASFDPDDIENGLTKLIGGIKTAFIASTAGVLSSLIVRLVFWLKKRHQNVNDSNTDCSVDDIVQAQHETNKYLKLSYESNIESNTSLHDQLKLLRTDQNEKLDMLNTVFSNFVKTQADNNSQALIEALQEVIKDFNNKITEQFGDNFKQLNEAVAKINEWQSLYKEQVNLQISQQEKTAKNLENVSDSFSQVVEYSKTFSQSAQNLNDTIGSLNALEIGITENTKILLQLIETSKSGLPQIENMITNIVNDLASTSTKISKELINNVDSTISNMKENIESQNKQITDTISGISKELNNQVVELDNALAESLKKSLESLGTQLSSLSEKFVNDYTPLTNSLREVVSIAKNLQS